MPISQEDREAMKRYNAWRDDKMTLGSLEREILSVLNRAVAAYDEAKSLSHKWAGRGRAT